VAVAAAAPTVGTRLDVWTRLFERVEVCVRLLSSSAPVWLPTWWGRQLRQPLPARTGASAAE
jgi:hypothetical protein